MGDDVKKEQIDAIFKIEYKGEPLDSDGIDYMVPLHPPTEYWPEELATIKEYTRYATEFNPLELNKKFADILYKPISFKQTKLIPGTEANPQYETVDVNLSAEETKNYLDKAPKHDIFTEVTRDGNDGYHLLAFCEANGLSIEDMEYAMDNPDTEKGMQVLGEIEKARVQLYEVVCNENVQEREKQAIDFYADYVDSQSKFVCEYARQGGITIKDVNDILKHAAAYQSILQQTFRLGERNDDKVKARAVEFTKKIDKELENRGKDARFNGLSVLNYLAPTISQGYPDFRRNIKDGTLVNSPEHYRDSSRSGVMLGLVSCEQLNNFIVYLGTENPEKVLGSITEEKANQICEEAQSDDVSFTGFETYREDGRKRQADIIAKFIVQRLGTQVAADEAEQTITESLNELNTLKNTFKDKPQYSKNIKEIITAGKNYQKASAEEKEAATRDLKVMTSLLLSGITDEDLAKEPELINLQKCTAKMLGGLVPVPKAISLDEFEVVNAEVGAKEASRYQEESYEARMAASQKKIWGKGSPEFANIETALKEYNKLVKEAGDNPTLKQSQEIREYTLKIKNLSDAYLATKQGKDLNKNGRERFDLVTDMRAHFDDQYFRRVDDYVNTLVAKPNAVFFEKALPEVEMKKLLGNLDHAAFRSAYNDLGFGGKDDTTVEKLVAESGSVQEFKDKISAHKTISEKAKLIENAELLFKCQQKDVQDAPNRRALAEQMLQNAKYPKADRESLEKFAKEQGIAIKDPAGDEKYLQNVEKIRQLKIKDSLDSHYKNSSNDERWINTLLRKPGLKEEEKQFILGEMSKPYGQRNALYEYAINELATCKLDPFRVDTDIDTMINNYQDDSYYREFVWDKDTMFNEFNYAKEKGSFKIDDAVYSQAKIFANAANGNASYTNTKLNQYERMQSQVLDFEGMDAMNVIGMVLKGKTESDKCYLTEQGSFMASAAVNCEMQEIAMRQDQLAVAQNPKCIKERLETHVNEHLENLQTILTDLKAAQNDKQKSQELVNQFVEEVPYIMYFNSSKLSADKMTKEQALSIFDPEHMNKKIPALRDAIVEQLKVTSFDVLEQSIMSGVENYDLINSTRATLAKQQEEKSVKKEAELQKDVALKKEQEAPKKEEQQVVK